MGVSQFNEIRWRMNHHLRFLKITPGALFRKSMFIMQLIMDSRDFPNSAPGLCSEIFGISGNMSKAHTRVKLL